MAETTNIEDERTGEEEAAAERTGEEEAADTSEKGAKQREGSTARALRPRDRLKPPQKFSNYVAK